MADPVSTAFVEIRPDTRGFEAELRASIAKSVKKPIPVKVVPDTAGFVTALRTSVRAALAKPVAVPVKIVPNTTGFAAALRSAVAAKSLRPIPVPVRPVLVGTFRSDLRRLVAGTVTTPIPVPVAGATSRAALAATGSTATAAQSAALISTTTRAASAQNALTVSTKRSTKALSEAAEVAQFESGQLARLSRGAAATGLSLFGLRGATLAATSAFLIGAASVTALAKALGVATSFNSQLAVFAATTGATASELEQVSAAAKTLGKDLTLPGVTATDAAEAMTELAKAGLSVQDSIAGARGVLQLAKAANIDNAQATELAAAALNAFSLAGSQATVVADTLANAANLAQGSILDVGIAFQQAASIGHTVGLTFQDTTLFITELAKAGLTGSDAGTSLRTALVRLVNPTKKARDILHDLGVSIRDASGNLRPDFFVNLGIALQGVSKAQRDQILATLGGQDAVRAFSILTRQNIKDLVAQRDALHEQGTAARIAGARLTGLAGAGANLQNTVEAIALSLGQKATPKLIAFTNGVTNLVQQSSQSGAISLLGASISATTNAISQLFDVVRVGLPVLGTFVNALSSLAVGIGVGNILAAAVAFKVLKTAFAGLAAGTTVNIFTGIGIRALIAADAVKRVAFEVALLTSGTTGLKAGLGLVADGFAALASSGLAVAVAIAAVVGGLVVALSRMRPVETATKNLKKATDELSKSLEASNEANQARAGAAADQRTNRIAVTTAALAVAQARAAASSGGLTKGTIAYAEAQNQLAIATNNLKLAQDALKTTQDALLASQFKAQAAGNKVAEDRQKEADALQGLLTLERNLAAQRSSALPAGTTGTLAVQAEAEADARRKIVQVLRDQATEAEKTGKIEDAEIARRKRAIADLIATTQRIPSEKIVRLIIESGDFRTALDAAANAAAAAGDKAGAAFLRAYTINVGKPLINFYDKLFNVDLVSTVIAGATNLAIVGGKSFAAAFGPAARVSAQAIAASLRGAQRGLTTAEDTLVTASIQGLTPQQTIPLLRAAEAAAQKVIDQATKGSRAWRDARSRLDSLKSQERTTLKQISDDATANSDAAKQAQKDAEAAAKAADQAVIDSFGTAQLRVDLAQAAAEGTKSIKDDLAANVLQRNLILREIATISARVKDQVLKTQAILRLQIELKRTNAAIRELVQTQKDAVKQRIIDARDRKEQNLDLNVQIAEAQGNKAKELQAHRALLAFLIQRQKHTTAGTLAWRQLQLKIVQERKAINDLTGATKERQSALGALEFEFLQAEQGFASRLLSNLLPTNLVSGTLTSGPGSPSIVTPTTGIAGAASGAVAGGVAGGVTGAVGGPGRPPDVGDAGLGKAFTRASASKGAGAASAGQMAALIHIQRQMLTVLLRLTGQNTHPEATQNRRTVGREWEGAWS